MPAIDIYAHVTCPLHALGVSPAVGGRGGDVALVRAWRYGAAGGGDDGRKWCACETQQRAEQASRAPHKSVSFPDAKCGVTMEAYCWWEGFGSNRAKNTAMICSSPRRYTSPHERKSTRRGWSLPRWLVGKSNSSPRISTADISLDRARVRSAPLNRTGLEPYRPCSGWALTLPVSGIPATSGYAADRGAIPLPRR